jgi:outer membrane immunogenic protein
MRKFAFSLAIAVVSAIPAVAHADPFNGPFVGVQAGLNHDDVGTLGTRTGDLAIDRTKNTFIGGVYGGYDVTVAPRVVIGVEGGFNLTSADLLARTSGNDLAQIKPSYGFDFSARAGYLVANRTLLYVRGGYDNVRARVTDVTGGVGSQYKQSFDGWMAGGGVERYLTDKVSARVEYRFSKLDDGDGKFDRHQALLGVAYHF